MCTSIYAVESKPIENHSSVLSEKEKEKKVNKKDATKPAKLDLERETPMTVDVCNIGDRGNASVLHLSHYPCILTPLNDYLESLSDYANIFGESSQYDLVKWMQKPMDALLPDLSLSHKFNIKIKSPVVDGVFYLSWSDLEKEEEKGKGIYA